MEDTLETPTKTSRESSASPEIFAGFSTSESEVKWKKMPESPGLRVSQPRSSKSRASLVWQKTSKTIKEEPCDEMSPIKATNKKKSDEDLRNITKPFTIDESSVTNVKNTGKNQTQMKRAEKNKKKNKEETLMIAQQTVKEEPKEEPVDSDNSQASSLSINDSQTDGPKKVRKKRRVVHNPNHKFKCNQCGRRYKYMRGMRQHQKLECNKEPQFPCPYCPSRFRYRQIIREHVKLHHEQAFPKWFATHYVMPMLAKENI